MIANGALDPFNTRFGRNAVAFGAVGERQV
jgi:hypothetical protein